MHHTIILLALALFCGLFFPSCRDDDDMMTVVDPPEMPVVRPNILLIISDDMGKDATNGFTEGDVKPQTPHLDALANQGLTFSNLWVNPTCSPTRAAIMTGRYGFRTGVTAAGDVLPSSETILPKLIGERTENAYATAVVGKWHLAGNNATFNPETLGVDYYGGFIRGTADDYYDWPLNVSGVTTNQTDYITDKLTDLAIEWVNGQTKPWLLWLAYTAPHTPFHLPPAAEHSQGNLAPYTDQSDPLPYYLAAIEAMDFQIGRLLENLPADQRENTVIIYLGDNGTPPRVAQAPYRRMRVKETLYQGGINTPLFISGKGVSRTGADNNLVTATDIFTTILDLAGGGGADINDGKSLLPLFNSTGTHRDFQYAEIRDGSADTYAIRDMTYKLIVRPGAGEEELYNLIADPYETNDLLTGTLTSEELSSKARLEAELAVIRN